MQSLHLMFKPSFLAANFPNALIGRSRPQALQTFVASAYTLLRAFRLRRSEECTGDHRLVKQRRLPILRSLLTAWPALAAYLSRRL
jgi:hypothetical protein